MAALTTTLFMPHWIEQGLETGKYMRIGGIIQEATTGKVVLWLREIGSSGQAVAHVGNLVLSTGAVASVLSLGITTCGFALVLERLNELEARVQAVQKALERIGVMLDITFYANLRAALDMATNALTMNKAQNREAGALQAIDRLALARHHYTALVDLQLAQRSQVADEYLATLALAYVAEARCYLELEEIAVAQQLLQTGAGEITARVRQHVQTLLTSNPAVYLHPLLRDTVDLRRLTAVLRWVDPTLTDEHAAFEDLRENLFNIARSTDAWIQSLPPAIWDSTIDLPHRTISLPRIGEFKTPGWTPEWLSAGESTEHRILQRLPSVMATIEALIEDAQRLASYHREVQALQHIGLPYHEWQHMLPPPHEDTFAAEIMYILQEEPHQPNTL